MSVVKLKDCYICTSYIERIDKSIRCERVKDTFGLAPIIPSFDNKGIKNGEEVVLCNIGEK